MQNPSATYHLQSVRSPSSRYVGLAFTAAINVAVIWAIINGLTHRESPPPLQPTHITFVKPDVLPTPTTKPPPPTMIKPTMPVVPVVPPPFIPMEQPSNQSPITVTTQPQQAVTPLTPDSQASSIADTHTTPPYPAVARRLDQQGVVTLQLSIDQTGAVSNATVRASSGYPDLDQTAVEWVVGHWRYKPATQNGTAVASTAAAAVKFDLKSAR